jgi:hypothetical protein
MVRKAKESGGGRLTRSETVTIRLDPRLNYLCEIAARVQRRTKSSFIEAVIDEAIHRVPLEPRNGPQSTTVGRNADDLWHVRAHERLIALTQIAPHLMTMDEQERWAVICEHGFFWRGKWVEEDLEEFWSWKCEPTKIITERVADSWDKIVEVAQGKAETTILPEYEKRRATGIPF